MSKGKYSPWCYGNKTNVEYDRNAYGEVPAEWDKDNYNEKTMFDHYDTQGFDSYGYSAFDLDGNYVGIGSGIDRYGNTELEYMSMSDDEFEHVSTYSEILTEFKRNRDEEKVTTKRKTKAEKQAEAEEIKKKQNDADWEFFKEDYPNRFAALLFDFFKFGQTDYNLSVVRTVNNYEFCWGAGWNRCSVDLSPNPPENYDWEYAEKMRDAERAIQEERDRIAEAERKEQIRQNALNKLTDEEKKILGFK